MAIQMVFIQLYSGQGLSGRVKIQGTLASNPMMTGLLFYLILQRLLKFTV